MNSTSCNKDLNEYKDIVELPPLLQNILSGINTLTNNYNNNFTSFNELKNKESPKIHIDFPVSGSSYITNQIDIKGSTASSLDNKIEVVEVSISQYPINVSKITFSKLNFIEKSNNTLNGCMRLRFKLQEYTEY